MNRRKTSVLGLHSLVSTGKETLTSKLLPVSHLAIFSTARFRGKLGSAIAVNTSLTVGFLTVPNNLLYFIDSTARDSPAATGSPDPYTGREYTYIHAGIALLILGLLAMVVSVVLSYFAAKSKHKMDLADANRAFDNTKTVLICLVTMNLELFMAVIAGCMELLYRPLTRDVYRLHTVECSIAVFNLVIYAMYVVTMILTSIILRGKREQLHHNVYGGGGHKDFPEVISEPSAVTRDYMNKGGYVYN